MNTLKKPFAFLWRTGLWTLILPFITYIGSFTFLWWCNFWEMDNWSYLGVIQYAIYSLNSFRIYSLFILNAQIMAGLSQYEFFWESIFNVVTASCYAFIIFKNIFNSIKRKAQTEKEPIRQVKQYNHFSITRTQSPTTEWKSERPSPMNEPPKKIQTPKPLVEPSLIRQPTTIEREVKRPSPMRESPPPRQPQKQPSEPKLTKVGITNFLLSIWKPLGLWWWGVWGVYTAVVANTAGKDYPFLGILTTILFVFCIYGTFWLRGKIKPPEKAPDRLINGVYFGEQSGIPIGKPISEDGHILVIGGQGAEKVLALLFLPSSIFGMGGF